MAMVRDARGEHDALRAFLAEARANVRRSVLGLDHARTVERPTASALTLAGLVKRLATVERNWTGVIRGVHNDQGRPGQELAEGETVEDALAEYAAVAASTDELLDGLDLDREVDLGLLGHPLVVGKVRTVRWVLLHLVSETAQHAGHADLLRESLDGATSFELVAAAGDPLLT
ncbi:putative damage-inducible protein DinB [Crossiella equi]|uniref:Damage-inducible protein DinB n=1 Tax=Crossiella equi TaxID=130796 RepID=A0ABS5AEB5_9PSEU|nr:DUF664 domain-containing protein [Crossiella equi]MBP2474534.1 putative damage-inducible protein DinB [Crossiella equi]